jgi:hypothetical protein
MHEQAQATLMLGAGTLNIEARISTAMSPCPDPVRLTSCHAVRPISQSYAILHSHSNKQ